MLAHYGANRIGSLKGVCQMCHGGGMWPSPFGDVIAALNPGDEIEIEPGYGFPSSSETRKEIIARVDGFSALTAAGTILRCDDGAGVTPTGINHANFELTKEALDIIAQVEADSD